MALLVARTLRGELTDGLVHPVDTFVQITDKLVAQLGAVRVVYTGNLLQHIVISNWQSCCCKIFFFIKRRLSQL